MKGIVLVLGLIATVALGEALGIPVLDGLLDAIIQIIDIALNAVVSWIREDIVPDSPI
jgi:hypothetical protein